ncbi:hypothetical protein DIS24_g9319 [Lasiodiplodia hormozganensis]|uniref:Uncharacterized protein n=1 Tax=Lasiodiplodia hormozganensis TaxID=869390 RepID=A0AA39XVQ8_9PEZI|nr:hypothetical protein DIS24_g9319 [Lasiodiplodia hormozganensis]
MAPPILAPLPIFGIALIGTAIVSLVFLHFWYSRLDRKRNTYRVESRSTERSPVDSECGLRERDFFRGSPALVPPGQAGRGRVWTTAEVRRGGFRGAEMESDITDMRGIRNGGMRSGAGDNPFLTPRSTTPTPYNTIASMRGGTRPQHLTSVEALRLSETGSAHGSDSVFYQSYDLADGSLHQPHGQHHHGTTKHAHGHSPLRNDITASTAKAEAGTSSSNDNTSNDTLKPPSSDESNEKRGSFSRSISKLSVKSKSTKKESSKKSPGPLEVHPWRLSYT